MTTYVARVNTEGEAESIWTTGVVPSPAEGADPSDSTKTIVHVTGDIADLNDFIDTKYYKSGNWVARAAKPGEYYNFADEAWVLDTAALYVIIRQERDLLLLMSDWSQVADSPLTDEVKGHWRTYRQELRTVPTDNPSLTSYEDLAWPVKPS